MSVRAYRIITKKVSNNPSFNLWHDGELLDFFHKELPDDIDERLSGGGGGTISISIFALKKAVQDFKWEKDDYRLKAIKKDIKAVSRSGDEWVEYECY